jgi:hypothetical protein
MRLLNSAFITLLPKTDEALGVKDYRPINLIHSFRKKVGEQDIGFSACRTATTYGVSEPVGLHQEALHSRQFHARSANCLISSPTEAALHSF